MFLVMVLYKVFVLVLRLKGDVVLKLLVGLLMVSFENVSIVKVVLFCLEIVICGVDILNWYMVVFVFNYFFWFCMD